MGENRFITGRRRSTRNDVSGAGFFDRNPALDVAPTPEACDHHHSHHEDSHD
ncbi:MULTISPECIES: hypothetical protein [unclassified Rhodococcus (in: high G+C Gram-positive bacteria)]|uniref:hypothetical protein n=1 Tax=unclassified Rhodococcus (in: high G+C Gram-positive bacteria) TaxID=192944 RepID=UPI001639C47F|nr:MULTISPECIES: hypothetical protein [unclassified Rhodococcus (in: high G+C Gram-positive bacteria)]MBC2637807.1 hypothetical protein [Rhodococcus sp. 3A]MBC2897447.1 hypothetical protein [Rhodococcus sp. 4CII]